MFYITCIYSYIYVSRLVSSNGITFVFTLGTFVEQIAPLQHILASKVAQVSSQSDVIHLADMSDTSNLDN